MQKEGPVDKGNVCDSNNVPSQESLDLPYDYQDGVFHSCSQDQLDLELSTRADVKLAELLSFDTPVFSPFEVKDIKAEAGDSEPCSAALAISKNLPDPGQSTVSQWRTFINTAYYHPNILAHCDVACLKEMFQLLGCDIVFDSINVMIDLEESKRDCKLWPSNGLNLRPSPSSFQKEAPIFTFAQIEDFHVEFRLKVCIVRKYSIIGSMKSAVAEMVNFIIYYPEALYLEMYGFILDFLLKFGVRSEVIIDAVMRTQRRRRKSKRPASILILKQARQLGKERKEFLEKRLLYSPENKYDPVIPVVAEPIPVRQLRNRRTGQEDRTPDAAEEFKSTAVKSQPFADSNADSVKRRLSFENAHGSLTSSLDYQSTFGTAKSADLVRRTTTSFKRKKFYVRRDKNDIATPFSCTLCPDRSFAYKGNLVIHMKKKHSSMASQLDKSQTRINYSKQKGLIPPFSCPVCLAGLSSRYRCRTHLGHFHPEQKDWLPIENFPQDPQKPVDHVVATKDGDKKFPERNECVTKRSLPTSQPQPAAATNGSFYIHPLNSCQEYSVHVNEELNLNGFTLPEFDNIQRMRTRQHLRTAVV